MAFPTTNERIEDAEQLLQAQLPERWRQLLLERNGGALEIGEDSWEVFPVQDLSDQRRAKRTAGHIVAETRQARQAFGFPPQAVAIAANGYGDYLILYPHPRDRVMLDDRVFHWAHDTGEATAWGSCADLVPETA